MKIFDRNGTNVRPVFNEIVSDEVCVYELCLIL